MISKEAKQRYDRERYFKGLRRDLFKDRRCKSCNIFMASRFGAHRTRTYCRDCRNRGYAERHRKREYYLKNRDKILAKLKEV